MARTKGKAKREQAADNLMKPVHNAPDRVKLLNRWKPDPRVLERVRDSCLYKYASCIQAINTSKELVAYMLARYHQKKRAFVVNGHEFNIGLHDIFFLTGLPINGKLVVGSTIDTGDLCLRLLGLVPPKDEKTSFIPYNWLLENFAKITEPDGKDIDRYIRAYYLYIIGCVICPSTYRVGVLVDFLVALEHTDKINDYAWGAAVWAHTYDALEHNGNAISHFLIEMFAFQYLPHMTRRYFGNTMIFPCEVPLAKGWFNLLKGVHANSYSKAKIEKSDEVEYNPYERIICDEGFKMAYPNAVKELEICGGKFPVICLNKAAFYHYGIFHRQLGVKKPRKISTPKDFVKGKERKGDCLEKNWLDYFTKNIEAWSKKGNFVEIPLAKQLSESGPSSSTLSHKATCLDASIPDAGVHGATSMDAYERERDSEPARQSGLRTSSKQKPDDAVWFKNKYSRRKKKKLSESGPSSCAPSLQATCPDASPQATHTAGDAAAAFTDRHTGNLETNMRETEIGKESEHTKQSPLNVPPSIPDASEHVATFMDCIEIESESESSPVRAQKLKSDPDSDHGRPNKRKRIEKKSCPVKSDAAERAWKSLEKSDRVKKLKLDYGLWEKHFDATETDISRVYSDVKVVDKITDKIYKKLAVGAKNEDIKPLLKFLDPSTPLSTLVVGNFNDVLRKHFKDCYFYDILFILKVLERYAEEQIVLTEKRICASKYKKIFLPILVYNHFFGICADCERNIIYIFDSLREPLGDYKPLIVLLQLLESIDVGQFKIIKIGCPTQDDSVSCGIFLCKFFEFCARGAKFPFNQDKVHVARSILIYELVNSEILTNRSALEIIQDKKLLILDLNGILVHVQRDTKRQTTTHTDYFELSRKDVILTIFKRPHYKEFLDFCLENFEVAIWSSRTENNLLEILDMLKITDKLFFFWGQENCAKRNHYFKDYFFKELDKVWKMYPQYNKSNTLLVDDTPLKAIINPKHTAIFPQRYDHSNGEDQALDTGGQIRVYLENLVKASDVQEFVAKNPLDGGQEALKEDSVDYFIFKAVYDRGF